jgi:hypothetical protein
MKEYREWRYSSTILDLGIRLHNPATLPPGKNPYPLDRRLGGLCAGQAYFLPVQGTEHRPSNSFPVVISTELSRLPQTNTVIH